MNIPFTYFLRLFVAVIITVSPAFILAQSVVDAVDDIAHTTKNKPVVIDALRNDYGVGSLRLDKVVLQNHGTARIENNKIVFTPQNDFKGAALINYTACDANNNCACGLVIIDISEKPLPVYQEIKIFIVEDATTKFTMPIGYKLKEGPSNGSVTVTADSSKGEWLFKPNPSYKGYNRCLFETLDAGALKTFEVQFEILSKPPQYVVNDVKFTRIGQPISFNVLANDNANVISGISYGACIGGQITYTDGLVTFTPNLPQGGKATFTYTVNLPNNKTETANVTIFVSNYLPSKDQFQLTCSGVPLVLHYPSPIGDFHFETLQENTNAGGKIKFYTQIDTIIATQRIKGKNILLYIPKTNAQPKSTDEFYVKYCIGSTCSNYITVDVLVDEFLSNDPQCTTECVWPGDTNGDGSVNILDLYPVGYSMGQYGKARNDESTKNDWYPHSATNWNKTTFGVDMKHADTNGDGIISGEDVVAIKENYGKNATLTPIKTGEESPIEIQLISSAGSLRPGDMVELIVSMGSSETPAYDTKGLSFSLGYNANLIKEQSISVDFSAFTWLSRYDAYLPLDKIVERGRLEAGLVRSKGKGANGHGEVGKVRAVVEDDVAGFRADDKTMLKFRLNNALMMDATGNPIKLQTRDIEIPLVLGKKTDVLKVEDLIMYPNPASDMVNFYINGINKIDYVRIMDGAGREVVRMNGVDAKSASVSVGDLRGFYIAEIMTEKGRIVKKLEIFK